MPATKMQPKPNQLEQVKRAKAQAQQKAWGQKRRGRAGKGGGAKEGGGVEARCMVRVANACSSKNNI